jgi:rubrerythrin
LASTFEVFRWAERIEAIAAEIYGLLARRFGEDPDAYALFAQLQAEEEQHAARIRLLAASYRNDSKLLPAVNGAAELAACLGEAERAMAEVRAGGWGPRLADVLVRVSRLEDRLARAHADLLALNGDPGLREFFEQLARMDDAHVELLVRT